jgi:hypothetical protein
MKNKCGALGFCAKCYAGTKMTEVYPGHCGWRPKKRRRRSWSMPGFGQRRPGGSSSGSLDGYCSSVQDAESLPLLVEFLTRVKYDDGSDRVPGSMTFFVEGGALKVCLSDKDQLLVGFLTLPSLKEALRAMEKALKDDKVDWRAQRSAVGRKK